MEGPFQYCKPETGRGFIGRKTELDNLVKLLQQGENIVLFDGPKTGKTSLLHQCFSNMRMEGKDFQTAEISFLGARDSESILARLYSAMSELGASLPADQANDPATVFSLPRRLSADTGKQIICVIDEFQEILLADDGEKLLKAFESSLKNAEIGNSSYIFCGSRVNAMKYIFEQKKYFFRCVEIVEMKTPDPREVADSLVKGFLTGGKVVDKDKMTAVCRSMRCNIWYLRHFASICDNLTKGYITDMTLADAMDALLCIHEADFIALTRDLTTFQLRLLKALVCGHRRFSSAETISAFGLNSSANVRRLKDALCRKEVISFDEKGDAYIIDPLFEYWIKDRYFNIK